MREAGAVRRAADELLSEFAAHPACYLREDDLQAALWAKVRADLEPGGPSLLVDKVLADDGTDVPHAYRNLVTGQVHREAEVWADVGKRLKGECDLIVLRGSSRPTLFCTKKGGPSDFKQRVLGRDVAVAVEIKAAPSSWRSSPNVAEACRGDLEKLGVIKRTCSGVTAVFILFDKSMSLPSASTTAAVPLDWARETKTVLLDKPRDMVAHVEVFELQVGQEPKRPPGPRHRYWPLGVP